ncbi:MAG: zinc ribbon domain-containing protein [Chloroflexota bacterium]
MFEHGDVEKLLSERFVCGKCRSHGASVEKLAMTGTGLSRLMDFQRHQYMFVSCQNCGYTEVYNRAVLEGARGRGMDILDLLFGN